MKPKFRIIALILAALVQISAAIMALSEGVMVMMPIASVNSSVRPSFL